MKMKIKIKKEGAKERIKEEEDKCQDVLLVPVPSRLSNT